MQLPRMQPMTGPGDEGIDDTEYLALKGKVWPLRLDMATCARFERATGVNMLRNWHVLDLQRMSMSAMLALLWAAMSQIEPELTLDEVGRMIKPADFDAIGAAVHNMVLKGIPPEDDAEESPSPSTDGEKKTS